MSVLGDIWQQLHGWLSDPAVDFILGSILAVYLNRKSPSETTTSNVKKEKKANLGAKSHNIIPNSSRTNYPSYLKKISALYQTYTRKTPDIISKSRRNPLPLKKSLYRFQTKPFGYQFGTFTRFKPFYCFVIGGTDLGCLCYFR